MSDVPLLRASHLPGSSMIMDLDVVETAGGPLVVCVGGAGNVSTWDPLRDNWQGRPLVYACRDDPAAADYPDAENDIDSVAAAVVDGRIVLAAGGDEQSFAFWDLESGELLRGTTIAAAYLLDVATVHGDGPPRFVTSTQYAEELLVWDVPPADPPVQLGEQGDFGRISTGQLDGRSLLAVGGCYGGGVKVWDVARAETVASCMPVIDGFYAEVRVTAVALSRLGNQPIAVAAIESGEAFVWELSLDDEDDGFGPDPLHGPMTGHEGWVNALDTILVGDRSLAVTGGEDGTVRIWDLAAGTQIGAPLTDHKARVEAVRTMTLDGREVALTAGRDGAVRVWDLAALLRRRSTH